VGGVTRGLAEARRERRVSREIGDGGATFFGGGLVGVETRFCVRIGAKTGKFTNNHTRFKQ
jgi:hypothetical protein